MSFIKKVLSEKLKHVLWLTVVVLLAIYLLFGLKYKLVWTNGTSMEPTIQDREMLVALRVGKNWSPSRYDIVVIQDSDRVWPRERITKRIIGLGGERIKIQDGYFYINGKKLKGDSYGSHNLDFEIKEITIPKGCVFVIGDNRNDSMYGLFLIEEVTGEVINVY